MRDIETKVADWRREIVAAGIVNSEILSELESHLREEFEHRRALGLSDEEAFSEAAARVGDGKAIYREIEKVEENSGLRFGIFHVLRLLVISMAWSAVAIVAWSEVTDTYLIADGRIGIYQGFAAHQRYGMGNSHTLRVPEYLPLHPHFGLPMLVMVLLLLVPWWRMSVLVQRLCGTLFILGLLLITGGVLSDCCLHRPVYLFYWPLAVGYLIQAIWLAPRTGAFSVVPQLR